MSQEFNQATPSTIEKDTQSSLIENKDSGTTVVVEEIVPDQRDERKPDNHAHPNSNIPYYAEEIRHIPAEPSKTVVASQHSVKSPSTDASTHAETSSIFGTSFSSSRAGENVESGLEIDAVVMRKIVEDVVEAIVEEIVEEIVVADIEKLTIATTEAGPKMKTPHTKGIEEDTMVVEKLAVRPVRPTLANTRSSSFFDVREGDSTPRRWRRKMDRNAMANPGATIYVPNNS